MGGKITAPWHRFVLIQRAYTLTTRTRQSHKARALVLHFVTDSLAGRSSSMTYSVAL